MITVYISKNFNQLGNRPMLDYPMYPMEGGGNPFYPSYPVEPMPGAINPNTPEQPTPTAPTVPVLLPAPDAVPMTTTAPTPGTTTETDAGAQPEIDWITWGKQNPFLVIAAVGVLVIGANLIK